MTDPILRAEAKALAVLKVSSKDFHLKSIQQSEKITAMTLEPVQNL